MNDFVKIKSTDPNIEGTGNKILLIVKAKMLSITTRNRTIKNR